MVLKSSTSWLYLIILVFIDFIYGMFNKKKDIQLEFFFIYTELHRVLWKYQTRGRFGQTVHQNITIIERFKKWTGLNKVIGLNICPPDGTALIWSSEHASTCTCTRQLEDKDLYINVVKFMNPWSMALVVILLIAIIQKHRAHFYEMLTVYLGFGSLCYKYFCPFDV